MNSHHHGDDKPQHLDDNETAYYNGPVSGHHHHETGGERSIRYHDHDISGVPTHKHGPVIWEGKRGNQTNRLRWDSDDHNHVGAIAHFFGNSDG